MCSLFSVLSRLPHVEQFLWAHPQCQRKHGSTWHLNKQNVSFQVGSFISSMMVDMWSPVGQKHWTLSSWTAAGGEGGHCGL